MNLEKKGPIYGHCFLKSIVLETKGYNRGVIVKTYFL